MPLILAPWSPAMRLGQGFNSFTHEICVDNVIEIKNQKGQGPKISPAQTVSYTSKVVDKLSDVLENMNISYSSAIKKGTVEVSGNTNVVDENTFKSADLNAVVSVRVINQTVTTDESCKFTSIDDTIRPGTQRFNDIYGDCYISGYIEGGDFTGIVSVKALDRKNVGKVKNSIKTQLGGGAKDELGLATLETSFGGSFSNVSEETEQSVSISWTGGGQIKDEKTCWDIDSMLAAAAAFPAKVADCPQRAWAILTKYKANRSFVVWSNSISKDVHKALEYDHISSYTAELFDSFMDYKLLLKQMQTIINDRDNYQKKEGLANAIDTEISSLISVRSALRREQAKIVEAVNVLSVDPGILKRQLQGVHARRAKVVNSIVEDYKSQLVAPPTEQQYDAQPKKPTTEETLDVVSLSSPNAGSDEGSIKDQCPEFDFDSLIPAEIWEDAMPQLKPEALISDLIQSNSSQPVFLTYDGLGQSSRSTVANGVHGFAASFPPPPDGFVYPEVQVSQSQEEMRKNMENAKEEAKRANDDLVKAKHEKDTLKSQLDETIAKLNMASEKAGALELEKSQTTENFKKVEQERDSLNSQLGSTTLKSTTTEEQLRQELKAAIDRANASELEANNLKLSKKAVDDEFTTLRSTHQTVVSQLSTTRIDLEQANNSRIAAERESAQSTATKLAYEQRLVSATPTGRVWIPAIFYGDRLLNENEYAHVYRNMHTHANNKLPFRVNNDTLGCNPIADSWKSCVVVFRYDDKGPMRFLVVRQDHDLLFPAFS